MKKQILRLSLVLFSITSCVSSQEKIEISKFIHKVETHLTPKVIIKGEPDVFFNIAQRMEYYKIPGLSIAIINDGKIQWAKGYGYTSFDSIQPINQNTLFQAASISKPVAALATLKLVQDKKAYLDNNVNEYLKEWKVEENEFTEKEKVTIRRLLNHSAGLSVHGFRGYAIDEDIPTIMQVLNGEKPANSDSILPNIIPGSKYRYSGGGYTVIQHMATDMSGIPFQKFMKQTVLEKIGMNNSTYSPTTSR